jgi:homoserine dehydrogenase
MNEVRLWVVGLGTVGQWLLRAVHSHTPRLASRYGFVPKVVGVANARDGFVYNASGLDPLSVLEPHGTEPHGACRACAPIPRGPTCARHGSHQRRDLPD